MKLVVLGTSNSILKGGVVDGLRQSSDDIEIINLSIGASCSAFLLWQLTESKHLLKSNDCFFILDTLVNDETFVSSGILGYEQWLSYMNSVIKILPPSRTLVLGFSSKKYFNKPSKVSNTLESLCKKNNICFFSLRRVMLSGLRIIKNKGFQGDKDSVYEDPGHYHRHLSKLIGAWLVKNLDIVFKKNELHEVTFPLLDSEYRVVLPSDIDCSRLEVRSTSLREQNTYKYDVGESFYLSSGVIHGVILDASNTRGYLSFSDGAGVSLELCYNSNSPRMQIKFIHLREPIIIESDDSRVLVETSPSYSVVKGVHSRRNDDLLHGVRLLGFLYGNSMHDLFNNEIKVVSQGDYRDLQDIERRAVRESGLLEALIAPPEVPIYPRSFIEL